MENADVIIVGAGLAGLSCGVELVNQGKKVVILEGKSVVGGRCSSWTEKGMKVESGLHRVLGFYTHFPALIKKAGLDLDDMIQWEDEFEIILPDGKPRGVFGMAPLYKPVKTIGGALNNSQLLSIKDKLSLTRFFTAGLKDYLLKPMSLDQKTVLEYAQEHNVTKNAITVVLIPLTAGIFFLPPEEYSAFALFSLVGPYLPSLWNTREGAFKGGMTEVLSDPLAHYIEKKGGQVLRNSPVDALLKEGDAVIGVYCKGEPVKAKHVVLATSLGPAQKILKKNLANHPDFSELFALKTMPAVTIQIELTERAMPKDRTTFAPLTALSCFAEQSQSTFKHVPGRLSIILTHPSKYIHMKSEAIFEDTCKEASRLGISLKDKVRDYRVITEPEDFYSLTPGSEELRPQQKTTIPGLTLAGDYTKQKYVATMEGAVYSGKLASELVIEEMSH